MTFKELSSIYIKSVQDGMRESSYMNMTYNLQRYIVPAFGDLDLSMLTKEEIIKRIDTMTGVTGKISESTLKKNFILIKNIVRFGMMQNLVKEFLLDFQIDFSKETEKSDKSTNRLTDSEINQIIEYIKINPNSTNLGFLLSLCLGLKIGEICALRWSDFSLEERKINIRRTLQRVDDGKGHSYIIEQPVSSEKSRRSLPLSRQLLEYITENFSLPEKVNYFVTTASDSPCEPRVYRKKFSKLLKELGLEQVKFSVLQNFYATCASKNMDKAERMTSLEIF